LIIIGGIIIIILYITRVASNEKFKINIIISQTVIILLLITDELIIENQINENQEIIFILNLNKLSTIKIYNSKSIIITLFIILYLLLTIISVSKIIKQNKGPLRSKIYE